MRSNLLGRSGAPIWKEDPDLYCYPDTNPDFDPDSGTDSDAYSGRSAPDSGPHSDSYSSSDSAPHSGPDCDPDCGPDSDTVCGPDTDPPLVQILIQILVQILIQILVQILIQILIRILIPILLQIRTKWNPQACLQKHEESDGVHEGGVELEVDVCGADVVAGAQDPLPHQGGAHREVQTKVFRNPWAGVILCKRFKKCRDRF